LTPLVNAQQLAAMLGVSKSTVLELAQRAAIPHYRISRSVRFDAEAVLEAMKER
jgi:excisionase family DNA binding protein